MSVKHNCRTTAFPVSDLMWQSTFSPLVLSLSKKRVSGCSEICQVYFGRFVSIPTTAFTVIIANWRQLKRVMGAMLERQTNYMWERAHMRDFSEVIDRDFTEGLRIQNFRRTRSTFDGLFDAIGPLAAPAVLCPREPVPPDKRIMWPLNARKEAIPFQSPEILPHVSLKNKTKHNLWDISGEVFFFFFFFSKWTCFH